MSEIPRTYLSTTFVCGRQPVTGVLRELRAHEVTAVELGSTHSHEPDLARRLSDEFDDFSILTHNFFPTPLDGDFVINLSDSDRSQREASIEQVAANVAFASRIGSRLHTLHPGFVSAARPGSQMGRNYDFEFTPAAGDTAPAAFGRMLDSLRTLSARVSHLGVPLAIETQGTVTAVEHCLFQTASDALAVARELGAVFGVNCNLGHLTLAARQFGFDRLAFVDALAPHIRAFEISHNDGSGDHHLPLVDGEWYWDVITDPRFVAVPMIVELRDARIDEACATLRAVNSRRPGRDVKRPEMPAHSMRTRA